ncbi:MAG TPA: urea carboxylase [Fibrobacteria bacterium]|nr:urea carboxylase [Fibrobacteria bacterium]
MFTKVLIANRGAIACRVVRTLDRLGIASVAVYSEADRDSLHVDAATESVLIGPAQAAQSYLDAAKILEVALSTGAQAIHPGYGFLSENAAFAESCESRGIAFLGPTPDQMRVFGLKHTAREKALECGVPLLPGTGILPDLESALGEADRIGYPVMLKSTAGGGGIGMRRCGSDRELSDAWESVSALAAANFKDGGLYLEKLVVRARHVEVQIFGDGKGQVVALGERDCSVQRRNQKVVEETPAPGLSDETRRLLREAALALGRSVSYRSAGTVEFVLDADSGAFWFLEVNTRLQVEHGVTEEVFGVDLVEWMVKLGSGDLAPLDSFVLASRGHSLQARVYAEDPSRNFQPSSGRLTEVSFPESARVETWVRTGTEVPPWYDPMVAKIIVHAPSRSEAIEALDRALAQTRLAGIATNLGYLRHLLESHAFQSGNVWTGMLAELAWTPATVEVLEGGAQTTVQDWPGRLGLWNVGIPPSGPMDALSFRMGNLALGNPEGIAGLEFVLRGPTLKSNRDTTAVLTGADFGATLDGVAIPVWRPFYWPAGSLLRIPRPRQGSRGYLLVKGGFEVPEHLGSKSTFTLGQFGGHGGRAIRVGDQLPLDVDSTSSVQIDCDLPAGREIPDPLRPLLGRDWTLGVLLGPHAAPDYFLPEDMDDLFGSPYTVHYNSDRTGVRLVGPRPRWAREDGGEAGLHPSNLHDNAYVVGTVDFTGDTPVILGPDGPSLGGFACPVTLALSEVWKLGQLSAGDTVRFSPLSWSEARTAHEAQEEALRTFVSRGSRVAGWTSEPRALKSDWHRLSSEIVLHRSSDRPQAPDLCVRQDGDDAVLFEFGPMVLDLEQRLRVHLLLERLESLAWDGILDCTPGIRSLQVRFDPLRVARSDLLDRILSLEATLPAVGEIEIRNRVVHLPLSWDDPQTRLAIEKYAATVRPDAPWCPSNIEFIRRINGLGSCEEVQDIVFQAEYLVMGLGDVYLGAPVATPLDPRHRLVTTKYNPARTWTPENAVGIGGAYLCVYGMEGPGGYQFVGRTVQMWNRWNRTEAFPKPWLLRSFDILRFHPVSASELLGMREDFPRGRWSPKIESSIFRMKDYLAFLSDNAESIDRFRRMQRKAFQEERARWAEQGVQVVSSAESDAVAPSREVPDGCEAVAADIPGSVWKVLPSIGASVAVGEVVAILESMKMESPVFCSATGTVVEIRCAAGQSVAPGQILLVVRT